MINGIALAGHMLMKRFALLVLLALDIANAPVNVQSSVDPSGAYRCDGVSPDGQTYRAAVQIDKNGDTFIVRWLTPRGIVNVGVGVIKGNSLSVGYVGSTGMSTGPHLCYRMMKNGKWVNPRSIQLPAREPVKASDIARFNGLRDAYMASIHAALMEGVDNQTVAVGTPTRPIPQLRASVF